MRAFLLAMGILAGCGGRTDDPTVVDAGGDGTASDTATVDTGGGTDAADAPAPACFDGTGKLLSVPYKVCTNDTDCVAKRHQISCCGDQLWVGVTKSQEAAFDGCEAASRAKFPGCGCPSGPPTTEDGKTLDFSTTPVVKCTNRTGSTGVCMTAAP